MFVNIHFINFLSFQLIESYRSYPLPATILPLLALHFGSDADAKLVLFASVACFGDNWQFSASDENVLDESSASPSLSSLGHYPNMFPASKLAPLATNHLGISPDQPWPRSQCSSYTNSKYGRENSCSSSSLSLSCMGSAHFPTSTINLSMVHATRPRGICV